MAASLLLLFLVSQQLADEAKFRLPKPATRHCSQMKKLSTTFHGRLSPGLPKITLPGSDLVQRYSTRDKEGSPEIVEKARSTAEEFIRQAKQRAESLKESASELKEDAKEAISGENEAGKENLKEKVEKGNYNNRN